MSTCGISTKVTFSRIWVIRVLVVCGSRGCGGPSMRAQLEGQRPARHVGWREVSCGKTGFRGLRLLGPERSRGDAVAGGSGMDRGRPVR